jgi:hypothetical protein
LDVSLIRGAVIKLVQRTGLAGTSKTPDEDEPEATRHEGCCTSRVLRWYRRPVLFCLDQL